MSGTLVLALRANFASIVPRQADHRTIALAAIIGLGILALAHGSGERTIPVVRRAPTFEVDPNTASKAELLLLPRVGPSLAGEILKERKIVPFESAEDVGRTKGIGDKTLKKLLPYLRVAKERSR